MEFFYSDIINPVISLRRIDMRGVYYTITIYILLEAVLFQRFNHRLTIVIFEIQSHFFNRKFCDIFRIYNHLYTNILT